MTKTPKTSTSARTRKGTPRDTTKARAAAVAALRDPQGRVSKPQRVLAAEEVHAWAAGLGAEGRGDLLAALYELHQVQGGTVADLLATIQGAVPAKKAAPAKRGSDT